MIPKDKGFFLLFMIGLLMIILSLNAKADSQGNMYGYYFNHSNNYPFNAPSTLNYSNQQGWEDSIRTAPIIWNDYAFYIDYKNKLYRGDAYNISDTPYQTIILDYFTGYDNTASPTISNGWLYVVAMNTSQSAKLFRINATSFLTGISYIMLNSFSQSSPIVKDGYIYIGTSEQGRFYQIYESNFTVKTYYQANQRFGTSSPACNDNYCYIANYDSHLYQFSVPDMVLRNRYEAPWGFAGSPSIKGNYVYISGDSGSVYQLNASNITRLIAEYDVGGGGQDSGSQGNYSNSLVSFYKGYAYFGAGSWISGTYYPARIYQVNASNISKVINTLNVNGSSYNGITIGQNGVAALCTVQGQYLSHSADTTGTVYLLNAENITQILDYKDVEGGCIDYAMSSIWSSGYDSYLYVPTEGGRIYQFYSDTEYNSGAPEGYYYFEDNAFSPIQCVDHYTLCTNTSFYPQGFYGADGLSSYGLYGQCFYGESVDCQEECSTWLESSPQELIDAGYNDYITGYCTPTNLTPPVGLDTCVVRGAYECTGGRSYDICQDSDGDGWLTYEHDTCLPYMICNDGSNSTPCVFANYTSWSWVDYTFVYTPSEDELLTTAKTNIEGNALNWDSYLNGDLRKAAQILSYPYFGILGFITEEAGTLLITKTVSTVEDLANNRGAYIGSYADNTNTQTYTSLNCDYTENITFDERTQARHLYSNAPLIINKTAWQNSELYNFDVSLDNASDDFSSLNITLSNGLNNQLDLLLEIDRAGKIITLTDMKTSNIILSEVYSAFDDFTNIHLLINHDKDFNSYTAQILGSFTPNSDTEWINSRSYSAPINASVGNPTMLIFTGGVADSIIIPNLLITRRSPYAGYKQSNEEPFSYSCQYTTNGCYLSRLFSSASNQPAYHRYEDVRVCTSGLFSNDNPPDTINNANICEDVLPGINTCGWSASFKIVVIIYALIGVLIIGAVLGLMAGYFAPAVAISLIIDTMIILFAGLTGFIPAWFFIVILLIASAIASVIIRNSLIGGGGGQNG